MIVTPLRPVGRKWSTLSFASTLYLKPVLDLLLVEVPPSWQPEIRLGLQEALVNAAKHGNGLDPSKQVTIQFSAVSQQYWWVITDQGSGCQSYLKSEDVSSQVPCNELECGRGLYILHQIFDRVLWDDYERHLSLYKNLNASMPLIY